MEEARRRIRDVVGRLDEALKAVAAAGDRFASLSPSPHRPATPQEIESFQEYAGHELPKTYRAFLELHNGYDDLCFGGSMLPVEKVMPDGEHYDDIIEWKEDTAENGVTQVIDGIVIGNTGGPYRWLYLDPNQVGDDGEMAVVDYDPEEDSTFSDLVEFFENRIAICRKALDESGG